jgi:hypothetical protein
MPRYVSKAAAPAVDAGVAEVVGAADKPVGAAVVGGVAD